MNLRENERMLFKLTDDATLPADKKIFAPTNWNNASRENEKKWGIFWTVNFFNGSRKKENLKEFFAWFVEFDDGDKKSQAARIREFIEPSLVIESKNGFHVYWFAQENTSTENYDEITTKHLIPNLNCDKSVRDLSRVLRVPGFFHWKDVNDPFLVKIVFHSGRKYSERDIVQGFPAKTEEAKKTFAVVDSMKKQLKDFGSDKLWIRIYDLNQEEALMRLSGTDAVCGETYEFRNVSRGHKNIIVNGEQTNCFIDSVGKIGSQSGGGPTVWQWVNWFHKDHKKTYKLLKQHLPEVFEGLKNE